MKTDENIKIFISLRKQNIYSNDFERLTLASLIMFERNCEKYLIGPFCIYLNIDDFINPKHRLIFESIQELSNNGIKIDLVTLSKTLKKNKSLKDIGGVNYLVSIIDDFTKSNLKNNIMKNIKKIPLLNSEGNILEMFLNENCELIMRSCLRGEYHHIQFKPNKFALVRYLKNICPLSHLINESEIMGLVFHEKLIDIPADFEFESIECYNNTLEHFSGSLCHNEISKLKNMLELFFDKENWF